MSSKIKKKKEKIVKQEGLVYETDKYVYIFQQYKRIRSFTKNILPRKINLVHADKSEINLLNEFLNFK